MSMITLAEYESYSKEEQLSYKKRAFAEAVRYVQNGEYKDHVKMFFSSMHSEFWGHTFSLHFRKTNDDLIYRLVNEYHLKSASTFKDRDAEVILRLLKDLLLKEETKELVATWMFAYPEEQRFMVLQPAGRIIGRGFTKDQAYDNNWKHGAIPCNEVCFVFVRDYLTHGFKLLSAYPEFDGMGESY